MTASWFLVALRHDRAVVLGSLAFVVLLAWSYLLLGAGLGPKMMDMGAGQMMAMPPEWSLGYGLVIFVMWAVMMLAMMLPSAAPVTLLIASLNRQRAAAGGAVPASTALFVFGYLAVWLAFAAAATTLQWALDEAGLLSETMAFGNIVLAGSVLVAAGVYQWTPLKEACLRHCRSPLDFIPFHWRDGALGAGGERRRTWLFLPRLLLDADGAPVRRRDHEPRLDRRHRAVGSDREDPALGRAN
jgi:predicted metal-binding membrane protein